MAAVAGALEPILVAGDEIVATPDIYGGSFRYFSDVLPRHGVIVSWAKSLSPTDVAACISSKTKVIYTETPTNPLVRVVDLAALRRLPGRRKCFWWWTARWGGPSTNSR